MSTSMVGQHAKGKIYEDRILKTAALANEAIQTFGADDVINGSCGVMYDENGNLLCLPTVEEAYRALPMPDIIAYAPVGGCSDFQEAVLQQVFGPYRPDGYMKAIASAGGAGAVSSVIWNYSDSGDVVLTHDWFWAPYRSMCMEVGRKFETFELFDKNQKFNCPDFEEKVARILQQQERVVVILNTPGNNPTGYTLSNEEWSDVLKCLKRLVCHGDKKVTLLIDLAYIDFVENPQEARSFMKQFSNLPKEIFIVFAFSMSKSFTMYGQRTGAAVGVSASKEVISEFAEVMLVTGRTRWSNINRAAMKVMANIFQNKELRERVEQERLSSMNMISQRARVFMEEADAVGLKALPYRGGFFITVPTNKPAAVSERLREKQIFLIAMNKGVRIGVCSIPRKQISGLAYEIKSAAQSVSEE